MEEEAPPQHNNQTMEKEKFSQNLFRPLNQTSLTGATSYAASIRTQALTAFHFTYHDILLLNEASIKIQKTKNIQLHACIHK